MIKTRLVIYSADICRIMGKNERSARALLADIRAHFGKHKHQFVTIDEFCQYTGLRQEQLQGYL